MGLGDDVFTRNETGLCWAKVTVSGTTKRAEAGFVLTTDGAIREPSAGRLWHGRRWSVGTWAISLARKTSGRERKRNRSLSGRIPVTFSPHSFGTSIKSRIPNANSLVRFKGHGVGGLQPFQGRISFPNIPRVDARCASPGLNDFNPVGVGARFMGRHRRCPSSCVANGRCDGCCRKGNEIASASAFPSTTWERGNGTDPSTGSG